MRHGLTTSAPVALLLAFSATVGPAAYAQRQRVLPRNSVLKVKLDDRLSSESSRRGERFTATVTDQGSGYSLPDGTQVIGTVTGVQRANKNRPGSLDVDFTALRLPDGQRYQVDGSPISLDSNSVDRTSDGRLVAKASNNKLKFIGYGAGAGFLIGSLLGSNIKGALAGAAAGYLYGLTNKNKANGHEVVLKPGTEFGVRLNQEVALSPARGYGYNRSSAAGYGYGDNRASGSGYTYNRASGTGYGASAFVNRAPARYAAREVVLPADSVLKVKLNDQLSSQDSRSGERFTATITGQGSGYDLPDGSRVVGHVTAVQPATSDRPGSMDVDFTALRLPDGQSYRITGQPISLDSNSVERNSNGLLVAKPGSSNNKLKFIGYGAGAGFLIGSLLGSNVKGALAGALAGYLFGQYHKDKANGHDVVLKPGTEFGVRLDQRVAINPAAANGYQSRVLGSRSEYDSSYRTGQPYAAGNSEVPALRYGRQDIRVLVNDRPVAFGSVFPIRSGDQVMVPVVPVLTAADANFTFDRNGRSVTLTGPRDVSLTAGSRYATVDGRRVTLSEPTRIVDGWLYAPPDFFRHALGMQTRWNANSDMLTLSRGSGR